jgi:hypothetical protein
MSISNDSTSPIDGDGVSLSPTFLQFCIKVRNNDPSILPEAGEPFRIRHSSEREHMELADALLENTSVTSIELYTENYTKGSAEAMAKYVRTSKRLQHIRWDGQLCAEFPELRHREEIVCCFMSALKESTSLEELDINFPSIGGPSSLAFEHMLTHTQSLRSLTLLCPRGRLDDIAVATARSGLKKNTTLRELTLDFSWSVSTLPPF